MGQKIPLAEKYYRGRWYPSLLEFLNVGDIFRARDGFKIFITEDGCDIWKVARKTIDNDGWLTVFYSSTSEKMQREVKDARR